MIYYASGFWKREDNGYFYYTDVSIMKSQYRVFQSIIHKFESRSKLLSEHCTHSSGIDPPKKYIVYYSNYASGKNGVYFFFFWGRRRLTFER
jgi:Ser-tRNA(Ala) deacylase AlaX